MDLLLNHFWELTITGLAFGAIYALIALGYTLVYGVLRLINFAHSEVFMWGSFAAVWVLLAIGGGKATGMGLVGYLVVGFLARAWRTSSRRTSAPSSWARTRPLPTASRTTSPRP